MRRLAARGVAAVDDLSQVENGTVIVRTHGVDPEVIAAARARGLDVIDATCPFVNVAHQKAEVLRERGYVPVILGERDHPEVVGLTAWAGPKAIVVEDADELRLRDVRSKRVGVVVQTTQTRDNLARLVARLAPVARETLVFNTICDATGRRQAAAQKLAARGRRGDRGRRPQQRQHDAPGQPLPRHPAAHLPHRDGRRARGRLVRRRAARRRDRRRLDAGRRDRRGRRAIRELPGP